MIPKIVADERTNSVIVSGELQARQRVAEIVKKLDAQQENQGNTRVYYLKYAKAEDLVKVLQGVSNSMVAAAAGAQPQGGAQPTSRGSNREVSIEAHTESNSIIMTAQPDMLRNLEEVIRQVDVRRAQVLVEAIIVEVGETAGINLGVQWVSAQGGMQQFTNAGVPISTIAGGAAAAQATSKGTTTTTIDPSTNISTTSTTGQTDPDYSKLAGALGAVNGSLFGIVKDDWGAVLQAVKADTNSNILATPHLTTLDNQESYFIVGEEVPVETGTTQSQGGTGTPFTTKERKEVGIKLKVTPQINEGNAVKLTIEQEVSSRAGDVKVDPILNKREIKTTVMADDGMTVVLGGLIDEDVQESESKIPLLGDIPVLGHLFRSTSSSKRKRNLMVFIRPTIMRDGGVMSDISQRKYNYIRAKQLVEQEDGIQLMPQTDTPELPVWGKDKELPPEIQKRLDSMDQGEKETGGNP